MTSALSTTKRAIEQVYINPKHKKDFADRTKCKDLFMYARALGISRPTLKNKQDLVETIVEAAQEVKDDLAELNKDNALCGKYFGMFRESSPAETLMCVLKQYYVLMQEEKTKEYVVTNKECKKMGLFGKKVNPLSLFQDCPVGTIPKGNCCANLNSIVGTEGLKDFLDSVDPDSAKEFLKINEDAQQELLQQSSFERMFVFLDTAKRIATDKLTTKYSKMMQFSLNSSRKTICEIEEESDKFVNRIAAGYSNSNNRIVSILTDNRIFQFGKDVVGFGTSAVHNVVNLINRFVAVLRWIYKKTGIGWVIKLIGKAAALVLKKAFDITVFTGKLAYGAALKTYAYAKAFVSFIINNPATSKVFMRLLQYYKKNLCREIGKSIHTRTLMATPPASKQKSSSFPLLQNVKQSTAGYLSPEWLAYGDDILAKIFDMVETMYYYGLQTPEIVRKATKATEKELSVSQQAAAKYKKKQVDRKVEKESRRQDKMRQQAQEREMSGDADGGADFGDNNNRAPVQSSAQEKNILASTWSYLSSAVGGGVESLQSATEKGADAISSTTASAIEVVSKVTDTQQVLTRTLDRMGAKMAQKGFQQVITSVGSSVANRIPILGDVLNVGMELVSEELQEVVGDAIKVQLVTQMNTDIVSSLTMLLQLVDVEDCVFQMPLEVRNRLIEKVRKLKYTLGMPTESFYSNQEIFSFLENVTYISLENKQKYLAADKKLTTFLGNKMIVELDSTFLQTTLRKETHTTIPDFRQTELQSVFNISGLRRMFFSELARRIEKLCQDNNISGEEYIDIVLENDNEEDAEKNLATSSSSNLKIKALSKINNVTNNYIHEQLVKMQSIVRQSKLPVPGIKTFTLVS